MTALTTDKRHFKEMRQQNKKRELYGEVPKQSISSTPTISRLSCP